MILKIISSHTESIPNFYHYFPEMNDTNATLVIELLGENLGKLHEKTKYFSATTVARIGLQAVRLRLNYAK